MEKLNEKLKKEKKPIELKDPAKAHAPKSTFEKVSEKSPEKAPVTTTTNAPIFGTFGSKLKTQNGNGDAPDEKTEEKENGEKPVNKSFKRRKKANFL